MSKYHTLIFQTYFQVTRKKLNIIRSSAGWLIAMVQRWLPVCFCAVCCMPVMSCCTGLCKVHWCACVFLCVLHWCVLCVLHWCAGHTGVCDCAWELLDSHEKLHALKHTSPSRSGAKCLAFVERKENLVCNILPFIPGAVKLKRKRYI